MSDSNNANSGNNQQSQQQAQQPPKPVVPDTYGTVHRRDGEDFIQHKVVRGGNQ